METELKNRQYDPSPATNSKDRLQQAVDTVNQIIMGKEQQVKLAFSCLLAGGHLLIEDLPGVGKTTLAQKVGETRGYSYFSFDNDVMLSAARADPLGFIGDLPERAILDEIQRAPEQIGRAHV